MLWRISVFLALQLSGVLLGWFLGGVLGAAFGVISGGIAWFVADMLRGLRVVHWLRGDAASAAPDMHGLWGEAVDRMRRALRARDRQVLESQQRLQEFLAAIQASPNGVVLLDSEGRIEWSNQTAADHLGIDPHRDVLQLIGNLVRDPGFITYYAGNDYSREIMIQGRESTAMRPVKLSVQLHPYGDGRRLLLSRDITGVEQAEAMRRDFVANVSHEIRTPLTVLAGFIETMQNLPLEGEDRARYLGLMAQQSRRMQTLVDDLLMLSRLEGSPLPGAGAWTAVETLMAQCAQEGKALSNALGKAQQFDAGEAPPLEIAGAAGELQSAISNLVSNAVRYTPAGGAIAMGWRTLPDGRGEFWVRDSGPGIAAEHIPRLTERFYRVDRSRSRETGGTGLGLAIVKHVTQRHNAELRIDSTPGVGSTFVIVFPASRLRPLASSAARTGPSATESAATR